MTHGLTLRFTTYKIVSALVILEETRATYVKGLLEDCGWSGFKPFLISPVWPKTVHACIELASLKVSETNLRHGVRSQCVSDRPWTDETAAWQSNKWHHQFSSFIYEHALDGHTGPIVSPTGYHICIRHLPAFGPSWHQITNIRLFSYIQLNLSAMALQEIGACSHQNLKRFDDPFLLLIIFPA